MLELPTVTLVCADTANHALALRALAASLADVRYGRALFLTDTVPTGVAVPDGVEVVPITPLDSRDAYSQLMLKSLLPHIDTPHALVIQWDGYVVNAQAWQPEFLDCDYIGAKWYWHTDGMRVGNGGFSLRSRKLLAALQDPRIALDEAEDTTIGRTFRPLLERDHAIRFADEALADRFSFEASYPIGRPFGFHGLFNFCRTVAPGEIATLAPGFSSAIARSPQLMQLLRNCIAMGQWEAARAIAGRVLAEAPDNMEARALEAQVEAQSMGRMTAGRNEPCPCGSGRKFKHCHGALGTGTGVTPAAHDVSAIVRTAVAAHQRGDLDGAERGYREALTVHPGHPMAMHYLGVAHYQRDRIDEALALLRSAVDAQPNEAEFHNNLGLALAAAGRNDEAIAAYRRALELSPTHAIAFSNLGLALQLENRLPEAIDAFRSAVSLSPDFPQAHWNLGLALLANQEFAEGWREYEWRFRAPELAHRSRTWPGPRWDGADPAGRTLLVTSEQGLGDTLHFIRLVQTLAERGARVVVSAEAPLVRLLATAPGVSAVIGPDDAPPPYDAHIPLMSLAGMLETTPTSFPPTVPYLAADPARRAEAAAMLAAFQGVRRVGLAWSGNRVNTLNRRRSIPLLSLAPLFALPGIAWFSLQRSIDEEEIASVPPAAALNRLPVREDFDGMAALVAELDLVVTIDTSIAHLGGALARPTWLMLAAATDWRWHTSAADTPWYPTFRLFRQARLDDWDAVVREVATALAETGILASHQPLDRVSEGLNRRAIAEDPLRCRARRFGSVEAKVAIGREARRDAHVVLLVPCDEIAEAGDLQHAGTLPAAHETPGQRNDRQSAGERVEARVAARPSQRIEHGVADAIDAQVIEMAALRQQDQPLVAVPQSRAGESAGESRAEARRKGGMPALECDEPCRWSSREHAREQRVAVRMDLEQRLGAKKERHPFGQSKLRARGVCGRRRTLVVGADPRQRDQVLGVVVRRVFRLHRRAGEVRVERRVARGDGMPPARALHGCEAKRRERKCRPVHSELGIHKHVERVGAYRRCDRRGQQRRTRETCASGPRAPRVPAGKVDGFAPQVVEDDLEAGRVEPGDPAPEIASARTVREERRSESDANPTAGGRTPRRRAPIRRRLLDRTAHDRGKARLQRPIVLALIGEQEVGPPKVVDHVGERAPARECGHFRLEAREPLLVARARERDRFRVRVHHRKRKGLAERGAKQGRLSRARIGIRAARRVEVVPLGERTGELEQRVRVSRRARVGAREERDGLVDIAALPCDARKRVHDSRIGLEAERTPKRVLRAGLVAKIEQQRAEIAPGERVIGLHGDRATRRRRGVGDAVAHAQGVGEVVPCARVAGIGLDGARERLDGALDHRRDRRGGCRASCAGARRAGAAQSRVRDRRSRPEDRAVISRACARSASAAWRSSADIPTVARTDVRSGSAARRGPREAALRRCRERAGQPSVFSFVARSTSGALAESAAR